MQDRQDRFKELMQDPDTDSEAALITSFLEETIQAIDAIFDDHAHQIAADYDHFRRHARNHNQPYYATLFHTLTDTIKRFHS